LFPLASTMATRALLLFAMRKNFCGMAAIPHELCTNGFVCSANSAVATSEARLSCRYATFWARIGETSARKAITNRHVEIILRNTYILQFSLLNVLKIRPLLIRSQLTRRYWAKLRQQSLQTFARLVYL